MNYENIYVADFETTTSEPTSVWLWGLNRLDGDHYEHGDSINQFIDYFIKLRKDIRIYFHNLILQIYQQDLMEMFQQH